MVPPNLKMGLLIIVLCACLSIVASTFTRYFVKDNDAKCIDGTPANYLIRKGFADGADKWHIHFHGGGWCHSLEECYNRKFSALGSSKMFINLPTSNEESTIQQSQYFSVMEEANALMFNWNLVYVHYCDGGSFAGTEKILYKNEYLYFHGKFIRDAVIDELLRDHSMGSAHEILLSGSSAGGLAIYLGIDNIAERIHVTNSGIIVRGLADSGFFLRYSNFVDNDDNVDERPQSDINFEEKLLNSFLLMNMTAGVNAECVKSVKIPSLCVFPEISGPFIRTPMFSYQSRFDFWQTHNILNSQNPELINKYGNHLSAVMKRVLILLEHPLHGLSGMVTNSVHVPNGLFISSCYSHGLFCYGDGNMNHDLWEGKLMTSLPLPFDTKKRPTNAGMTPNTAFEEWYTHTLTLHPEVHVGAYSNQHMHQKHHDYQHSVSRRLYAQELPFPCNDCCACKI